MRKKIIIILVVGLIFSPIFLCAEEVKSGGVRSQPSVSKTVLVGQKVKPAQMGGWMQDIAEWLRSKRDEILALLRGESRPQPGQVEPQGYLQNQPKLESQLQVQQQQRIREQSAVENPDQVIETYKKAPKVEPPQVKPPMKVKFPFELKQEQRVAQPQVQQKEQVSQPEIEEQEALKKQKFLELLEQMEEPKVEQKDSDKLTK